jgi:hypothetical protein
MALTKDIVVDQITVLEDGQVQIRTATRIMEDGLKLTETYHRKVIAPGDPTLGEDVRVVSVCGTVWTAAVIAAYAANKPKK